MYAVPNAFWAYHLNFKNHIITTRGSDMLVDYSKTFQTPKNLNEKITYYFLKRLIKNSCNAAKYITSTSLTQQNVLNTFISNKENLILTRTGVNTEEFLKIYSLLPRETNDKIILSNRAMSPLYNIDIIIDAFYLLKKKISLLNYKLVIIKYNIHQQYLKKITEQINSLDLINDVVILEEKNTKEMIQVYKNSDIIIMIPSSDGTPVSAIETMLAKKPLIIGPLEYDKDLFNEDFVWKLYSFSSEELCDKIIEVINSPEKKNKAENAYNAAIKNANLLTEVKTVESLYKKMIERHQ